MSDGLSSLEKIRFELVSIMHDTGIDVGSLMADLNVAEEQLAAERAARVAAEGQAELISQDMVAMMAEKAERSVSYARIYRQRDAALALVAERDATIRGLRQGLEELADVFHDTVHGVEDSVTAMRSCRRAICAEARALLAQPAADGGAGDAS